MKYIERIVNVATGETTEREYTAEEVAKLEARQTESQAIVQEEAARLSAKLAIYAKLGLTEEEINTLIS